MPKESEQALTLEFLRTHLKGMANLDLSEQAAGMYEQVAGLVAIMNALQPEGYPEVFPACIFRPEKE